MDLDLAWEFLALTYSKARSPLTVTANTLRDTRAATYRCDKTIVGTPECFGS